MKAKQTTPERTLVLDTNGKAPAKVIDAQTEKWPIFDLYVSYFRY